MPSTNMRKVAGALCGDREPSQPFACMALALRISLYETADIFVDGYVTALPASRLPSALASFGVLDYPFTLPELSAAIC